MLYFLTTCGLLCSDLSVYQYAVRLFSKYASSLRQALSTSCTLKVFLYCLYHPLCEEVLPLVLNLGSCYDSP